MSESRPDNCANCAKPCTIHISQVIDGKISKVSVCDDCPTAKNALDSNTSDILKFAGKKTIIQTTAPAVSKDKGTACPGCGFTREDFKERGRLGCSQCYQTFAVGLSKVLGKVQKGAIHKGKGSSGYIQKDPEKEIAELKDQLQALVSTEEYEEAAKVRDRIREMESL